VVALLAIFTVTDCWVELIKLVLLMVIPAPLKETVAPETKLLPLMERT
jgi:hypothetical protein